MSVVSYLKDEYLFFLSDSHCDSVYYSSDNVQMYYKHSIVPKSSLTRESSINCQPVVCCGQLDTDYGNGQSLWEACLQNDTVGYVLIANKGPKMQLMQLMHAFRFSTSYRIWYCQSIRILDLIFGFLIECCIFFALVNRLDAFSVSSVKQYLLFIYFYIKKRIRVFKIFKLQ